MSGPYAEPPEKRRQTLIQEYNLYFQELARGWSKFWVLTFKNWLSKVLAAAAFKLAAKFHVEWVRTPKSLFFYFLPSKYFCKTDLLGSGKFNRITERTLFRSVSGNGWDCDAIRRLGFEAVQNTRVFTFHHKIILGDYTIKWISSFFPVIDKKPETKVQLPIGGCDPFQLDRLTSHRFHLQPSLGQENWRNIQSDGQYDGRFFIYNFTEFPLANASQSSNSNFDINSIVSKLMITSLLSVFCWTQVSDSTLPADRFSTRKVQGYSRIS